MDDRNIRTKQLIGEDSFNYLQSKTIAVFGLGGVGGSALEALVRSGINKLIICDYDKVDISNLNRQILYTNDDVGEYKIEAAKKHLLAINPALEIVSIKEKVDENIANHLVNFPCDYIIDAIDDIKGKIALAKYALENHIPIIMSMGMANKIEPSQVQVMRLDKTTDDPLAKKMRYEIKKHNLSTQDIMCVCSKETPVRKDVLSSMMMVPTSAGMNIAQYVVSYLIKK